LVQPVKLSIDNLAAARTHRSVLKCSIPELLRVKLCLVYVTTEL